MKILATVLLGPGAEQVVGDAIRSAKAFVDGFLLIESGGGKAAVAAAREAAGSGTRLHEAVFLWLDDYAAARQFALEQARAAGATHAITLDPDERLDLAPNFRAHLEAFPEADVWILADRDTGYFKERVIRTTTAAEWHGLSCEYLRGRTVEGVRLAGHFWELPKTPEQEKRRLERGVVNMQKMIDAGDDCYRWRRHLGTCLMGVGRQPEALDCYLKGLPLTQHPDETAWMRYLICEQYVLTGRLDDARELAKTGLAEHAGFIPEFGWILAYLEHKAGNLQNASRWAQLVLHTPPDRNRQGFRGQNCKKGAKQILAAVHGTPEGAVWIDVQGIRVPTEGISVNMRRVLSTGQYEADERAALEGLLLPSDRVLELGAGIGYLATYCAQRLEDGSRVLTVEADPKMEAPIRATFAANRVAPALRIAAVNGTGASMRLERAADFWSTKASADGQGSGDPVEGVALSALLKEHQPTVLIIDIEGGETDLTRTVLPAVRAVLIEVHSDEAERAVDEWLSGQGFARRSVARRVRLFERN